MTTHSHENATSLQEGGFEDDSNVEYTYKETKLGSVI